MKKTSQSREILNDSVNIVNNKYVRNNSLTTMEPAQEHPLNIDFKASDSRTAEEAVESVQKDLDNVAIDWKLMNRATECSCSSPFDNLNKKVCIHS